MRSSTSMTVAYHLLSDIFGSMPGPSDMARETLVASLLLLELLDQHLPLPTPVATGKSFPPTVPMRSLLERRNNVWYWPRGPVSDRSPLGFITIVGMLRKAYVGAGVEVSR